MNKVSKDWKKIYIVGVMVQWCNGAIYVTVEGGVSRMKIGIKVRMIKKRGRKMVIDDSKREERYRDNREERYRDNREERKKRSKRKKRSWRKIMDDRSDSKSREEEE